MLKDSEGNQIAIEKTDTDVITIYATFYLTMSQNDESYVLPTPENNHIICGVLEDNYLKANVVIGANSNITTADELTNTAISTKTNQYLSGDYENKKWTLSPVRWNYDEANGNIVNAIGSPYYAAWKLPNTDIFPQITLSNMAVGTGDGETVEFNYTCYYENNSAQYPERFISANKEHFIMSGGYSNSYDRCPLFGWDAVKTGPSVGIRTNYPIILDFKNSVKINTFKVLKDAFATNYSG